MIEKSKSKFWSAVDRLATKIEISKVPVPGFIIGLSGTDSLVAFMMLHNAMHEHGIEHCLTGIHYAKEDRKSPTWFERDIIPWLRERYTESNIIVTSPLGGFHDQQRWADLMLRSTHTYAHWGEYIPCQPGDNRWLSGTINATEKELGKYSQMQKIATIQPIQTFWKTEILEICQALQVPDIAIQNSRLPDCLCGRDDLAAHNIELIDKLLRFESVKDENPILIEQLTDWIRVTKQENGFRTRTPYTI